MSAIFGIPANVVYATAAIYLLFVIATLIVALLRWRNPGERYSELSWWWMIGAFTLCILLNQTVAVIFLAFISYLALKEYLSLIPTRRIDREVLLFAYFAIPLQYYWAAIDCTACSSCSCRCGCSCSCRRSWCCAARPRGSCARWARSPGA
jgi:phosphatidate cytidylyltransferase